MKQLLLAIILFFCFRNVVISATPQEINNTITYTYQQLNLGKIIEYKSPDFVVRSLTNPEKLMIVNNLGVTLSCPPSYGFIKRVRLGVISFTGGVVTVILVRLVGKL